MRPRKCRIAYEELLELSDGRIEAASAERLREHLAAGCQSCEAQMAQIERLRSVMREGELSSAPEHVVTRAKELFRERFVKPARRSLLAHLMFDSRDRLAMAGARGTESGQIQTLYSTPEHDVDLWQERGADGHWYVIGQVMPKVGGSPVQPANAVLRSEQASLTSTSIGGEFHLASVPPGTYTLQIALSDLQITAEGVVIGT
jgi:hypothetical protein